MVAEGIGCVASGWLAEGSGTPACLADLLSEVLEVKLDYIHENPVRAGLVSSPGDWPDSSYRQVAPGEEASVFECDSLGEVLL